MATTQQATKNIITLKGSTAIVTEFFQFAVNSILFQRGVYPDDRFKGVKRYGLQVMTAKDPTLEKYLNSVTEQMQEWILTGDLQKMVLVITSTSTNETLERWTFNLETNEPIATGDKPLPQKQEKDIHREIASIIRQITASVTFLPLIDEACGFELLVYTKVDVDVPDGWGDSESKELARSRTVALRKFSTKVHDVSGMVCYRKTESESDEDD